jgi:hypothetical protein
MDYKGWEKCTICTIGTWVTGLSALLLVITGIFELSLPTGLISQILYAVAGIIILGFLYYQVTPCPRCVKKNVSY